MSDDGWATAPVSATVLEIVRSLHIYHYALPCSSWPAATAAAIIIPAPASSSASIGINGKCNRLLLVLLCARSHLWGASVSAMGAR